MLPAAFPMVCPARNALRARLLEPFLWLSMNKTIWALAVAAMLPVLSPQ
jgi:hypothetical protein